METLKQAVITAISQLPDTANIDDILVVLYQMKTQQPFKKRQLNPSPV